MFVAVFEEPEDPTNRSFFSEIISSISDVKFSNSGRYMISRDYLSVKVWDLHMESKLIETYTVSECLQWDCYTRNIPGMGHRENFDIVPLCTHRQTY